MKIIKIYKEFEQIILFYLLITYMVLFSYIFENELHTENWATILWLVQFFGFGTLLGLYSIKKNWNWRR